MSLTITLLIISISLFLGNLILIFLDRKPKNKQSSHPILKQEKKVELLESRLQSLEKFVLTNNFKGKIPSRQEAFSNLKLQKENSSQEEKDTEQIQSILNHY